MRCRAKELTDTADSIIKCSILDNLGDFGRGQSAVDTEEVCGEAGNVRTCHGSSAENFGPPTRVGGCDVLAGGPDTNASTIIGVAGLRVINIRIGDGDRVLSAGRRLAARVLVIVSGGHDDGDTMVVKLKIESRVSGVPTAFHLPSAYLLNGRVNSDVRFVTYAYGSNRGMASPRCLVGDPLHAGDTVVR